MKLLDGGEDRQGIVIWYVDHTMLLGQNIDGQDTIQYDSYKDPSDPAWPGVHSRVSLLPADGQFEMENNKNRGDAGDAFRRDATDRLVGYKISNAGVSLNGGLTMTYPSTKSIATGVEKSTGITIEVLDSVGYDMRVKVTLQDASGNIITQPPPPTPQPTSKVFPTSPPVPAPTGQPTTPGNKLGSNGAASGAKGASQGVGGGSFANVGPSPTPSPTDSVNTNQGNGGFTCDNFPTAQFTVTGVGNDPYATLYRECKFISNKPAEREATFCNADDERAPGNKVYMKCQKECASITGCNR